ncbi:methylenetetrahydrofolate dehydrogenase (NADP+) methenyltetrahydrofolate cyclohydrolase [Limosilactobacillus frumenti DSM 13145]|uniref:Bifunctional protein FolD n=1 Tax=Limosilactobacillus frumenti DSM 13145 TaxID=1423746 RepID=A0A0R1PBH8_9LACO|nr:bifunctional methylenetetrahydrofolate dehydrogenase/methenyltetrahydrofolate cyclohydrolase FolD [Limosilactobacillus frumenti]KRL27301.1 methylenetetrahydrofolate dehydrogenase (NADP+) methenyltetrahydrofolate cyclohydrolase [Limosilactobacillus frumenti DSM 13145]QFG72748.1 bifunctional methylenetetrahydrofolate dehydrogenase/methenyltetrahydrofolate cyclohydrolase FolD [Limosilactobacillus frumenti]
MAQLLDGRSLAKVVNAETKQRVAALTDRHITPGIAVIMVGDDPASMIYTRNKEKKARQLGIKSVLKHYPIEIDQASLMNEIAALNNDDSIDAIMIQKPLPKQLNETELIDAIDPAKDADGFHPLNVGKLFDNQTGPYPVSCTPRGIMRILRHYQIPLSGARAVVIGRSILVGKPIAALLTNADATVTLTNRHTKDLKKLTREADILVVAAGITHLIDQADVKPGATVIDVGMHRLDNGKLTGDVDFDDVEPVAGHITPVPGGVGPMTIASLMAQTVDLAEWRRNG